MLVVCVVCIYCVFFFCKQKTAYEMRISDWSSDVCSSDLNGGVRALLDRGRQQGLDGSAARRARLCGQALHEGGQLGHRRQQYAGVLHPGRDQVRSEEHTSELQSLMRNSYAVFCLKKKIRVLIIMYITT